MNGYIKNIIRNPLMHHDFPPRKETEQMIIRILLEHGGAIRIRDGCSGNSIYDEIGSRLNVPLTVRARPTRTGESAWRPEVGYARKNLEQQGIIKPTSVSGRGVWALSEEYLSARSSNRAVNICTDPFRPASNNSGAPI